MYSFKPYPVLLGLAMLLVFARPAMAFGAGNIAGISKVEGENWRHGDLEDTLLTLVMARVAGGKKFDKLNVSRVYFGNWLRDYSQAIDVGTVKAVSAEAIRLLLCVLGFLTFGYGSKEFEITAERLGCYRPEDHIDNPKNYADNEDATQYDRRLRGPVDEEVELGIDEETGMKNYIANERLDIMTSAKHVRKLFRRCIELGREYNRNNNKDDLYEALRLLGTGLHCLEGEFYRISADTFPYFLAHSNYTELALIELGERDVFPHVGRDTRMRLEGAREEVYPIVTGTFGGVDFLHSVTGEVSDKLTQSELDELEGTLQNGSKNDTSIIEGLLDKIPDGLFGGNDEKGKMHDIQDNAANSQLQNATISPRDPEEFTRYVQDVYKQIMPAIELHDQILKDVSKAIDDIPILPKIIEQLEEQMSRWTFSIMAPFVVPILQQVKNELRTGSSEIIESSKNEQHVVFNDDRCTDPTHSMLSKDHFSNILNEPAGKTASKIVAWVVPQIMQAWDDEGVDIRRLNDRIIHGVMHHPAQRDMGEDGAKDGRKIMFRSIEEWWNGLGDDGQDEYRRKLSRDGVEQGENHKEGVHDSGHGCGKTLGMHKNFAGDGSVEDRIAGAAANAIVGGVTGGLSDFVGAQTGGQVRLPSFNESSSGGQQESSGSGGFLGKMASSLLGGALGGDDEKETRSSSRRQDNDDGGYTESRTEYGRSGSGDRYGAAQYSETQRGDGGRESEYRRYEQDAGGRGSGYEERTEERRNYGGGGGYEERTETRYESTTESYGGDSYGGRREESYGGGGRRDDDGPGYGREESYGRREESYGRREEPSGYGGGGGYGESAGYGGGREERSEYGRGDREEGGYGRREEYGRGGDEYGEERSYGRRDEEEEQRRPGWGY
ncbi:hypothetical protein SLS62_006852 [Diatrype stigma]|uniref:Uncharacterized protein n=1 Tax=Diatrype stigma TaxID=117547 RepID=A0AAN9UP28_9PEZI